MQMNAKEKVSFIDKRTPLAFFFSVLFAIVRLKGTSRGFGISSVVCATVRLDS